MKQLALFSIVAVASLSGCAPLQQAPLLYSSKVTVGLDLSASTTESPGASINIGVKTVDAAYVPVAVSKDSAVDATGNVKPFDITMIYAKYGEVAPGISKSANQEESKRKINDYLEAKKAEDPLNKALVDANATLDSEKKKLDALNATVADKKKTVDEKAAAAASLKSALAAANTDWTAANAQVSTQETKVASLESARDPGLAVEKKRLDDLKSAALEKKNAFDAKTMEDAGNSAALTQASSEYAAAQSAAAAQTNRVAVVTTQRDQAATALDKAVQASNQRLGAALQAASLLTTQKTDAMSVYGRFDSVGQGAAGSSSSAALTVGKIFSTGVASQNLTEAVKNESLMSAQTACLDNLLKLAAQIINDNDKKNELIAKADVICK